MNVAEVLERIAKLKVLVVGDVCLDRWAYYQPELSEPSRETGIPRIAVTNVMRTPGAAGTVACNAVGLGAARVAVLGLIGDDGHGKELIDALCAYRVETELLVRAPFEQTFTYTKLINDTSGVEDLPRVDFINCDIREDTDAQLCEVLRNNWHEFDVILVSDQAETARGGAVSKDMRRMLTTIGEERNVWVDSRMRMELFVYNFLKSNHAEAQAALLRSGAENYQALAKLTEAHELAITHGPKGVLLADKDRESWVPARPVEKPVDICGAGDSFMAGMALAWEATGDMEAAAAFGNLVASITIMKPGTGFVQTPAEVLAAAVRE